MNWDLPHGASCPPAARCAVGRKKLLPRGTALPQEGRQTSSHRTAAAALFSVTAVEQLQRLLLRWQPSEIPFSQLSVAKGAWRGSSARGRLQSTMRGTGGAARGSSWLSPFSSLIRGQEQNDRTDFMLQWVPGHVPGPGKADGPRAKTPGWC